MSLAGEWQMNHIKYIHNILRNEDQLPKENYLLEKELLPDSGPL